MTIEIWKIKDKRFRNALFSAEQCNRTPVTALWLLENPDCTGYIYTHANDEMGLEPWKMIQGVDQIIKTGQVVLETGNTSEIEVHPDFIVFVPKSYNSFKEQRNTKT